MKFLAKEETRAVFLMLGCIVGAGILAMPYAISKTGILYGGFLILAIGLIVMLLNLYMGEIVLRTKKIHELAGYAEKYVGISAKKIMTISMFAGVIGALIAYTIGEGQALNAVFGWNNFWLSLIFFAIAATLLYFDLRAVSFSDLLFGIFTLSAIFLVIVFSIPLINPANLMYFDASKIFFPYGVILFAFAGISVIPELMGVLSKRKRSFKKCIIIGSLIPVVLYFLFSVIAIGVSGLNISEVATVSLGSIVGEHVVLLGNMFAICTMLTSFLTLGLALKWTLHYDYGFGNFASWFATCMPALAIFLLGITDFITAILLTGAIAGGVDGLVILFMFHGAKKKGERTPEYSIKKNLVLDFAIGIVFIAGIIYGIFNILKAIGLF